MKIGRSTVGKPEPPLTLEPRDLWNSISNHLFVSKLPLHYEIDFLWELLHLQTRGLAKCVAPFSQGWEGKKGNDPLSHWWGIATMPLTMNKCRNYICLIWTFPTTVSALHVIVSSKQSAIWHEIAVVHSNTSLVSLPSCLHVCLARRRYCQPSCHFWEFKTVHEPSQRADKGTYLSNSYSVSSE